MKKYIGTKQIEAEPMTMGEAYERGLLQVGRVPDAEYAKRMGYHVKYADGYESWSPAEPFEEAYKLADTSLDRMQIEAEEVNGRYVKLAAFIDSGKMDEVVNDMYNKCLLEMQCCTMFDYIRLLDTRIQRMQGSDGAKVIKMNLVWLLWLSKAGFPIRRSGWNGKGLMVFKQVPAHIDSDIIPKMQSIPQSAKDLILKGKGFIDLHKPVSYFTMRIPDALIHGFRLSVMYLQKIGRLWNDSNYRHRKHPLPGLQGFRNRSSA